VTGEDLSKEEHVDNEFLWNLKLLSEVFIGQFSEVTSIHCCQRLSVWCLVRLQVFTVVRDIQCGV